MTDTFDIPVSQLFAKRYLVICQCGEVITSFEQFIRHDENKTAYERRKVETSKKEADTRI